MTAIRALRYFVAPVLEEAASRHRASLDGPSARVMTLATGLQESKLVETIQRGRAGEPLVALARGWHQFERGGNQALGGVLANPATAWARDELCAIGYPCNEAGRLDLHWCLAYDQRISVILARALLWTLPQPLPGLGDCPNIEFSRIAYDWGPATLPPYDTGWPDPVKGWWQYLRAWRPGVPRPEHWMPSWRGAIEAVHALGDGP